MLDVVHVITGLDLGGTEMALVRLAERTDRRDVRLSVISLTEAGALGARLVAHGVEVDALGIRSWRDALSGLRHLRRRFRARRPDAVLTWLHHADILGGLAARTAGVGAVAWGIRSSDLHPEAWKRRTVALARAGALLSHWVPRTIVCGSDAARVAYAGLGYDQKKMVVIRNGVDLPVLAPDARARVRTELGVAPDALLVGRTARFHPHKDHRTFLEAAAVVHRRLPSVHFVLCGTAVDTQNAELMTWINDLGLAPVTHLLGERADVPTLHAGLDVACSSSIGEGFPNVVAEAMAAGVPVVGTNVGDTAAIIGETGAIVEPRDPVALADALTSMLELPVDERHALGAAARARVEREFSIERMTTAYAALYEELARDTARRRTTKGIPA